jgi:hypothetical protein
MGRLGVSGQSCTFRAFIPDVAPDDVYRSVRLAGGFRSWVEPDRTVFQVGQASIALHWHDDNQPSMLVNGKTVDDVHTALARIGYHTPEVQVEEIKPKTAAP